MLVQLASLGPIWTLFVVIGILTMFGRKKKDEKAGQETEDSSTSASTSAPNTPPTPPPVQAPPVPAGSPALPNVPSMNTTSFYQPPRSAPVLIQADEDSSLSRLLQSLLKDLPPDSSTFRGEEPRGFAMYFILIRLPPRATPTSRPMMI